MKFLLDENISKTVTQRLRDAGFDVVHVRDVGLVGKLDEEIMATAVKENRVIITHDKDFGNILRFPLQKHDGVIMMRFRNQHPSNVATHLLNFLNHNKELQFRSRLIIMREEGWRII